MASPDAHAAAARAFLSGPGPALLVAAATCLAYANSFAVPFQFDDGNNIVRNPAVRDVWTFLASGASPRRWLGFLSFAMNGSLGGQSVAGFHAVNLLVHVLAALGVLALARLVLRLRAAGGAESASPIAGAGPLLAALVFALHPIQTQAVTYVVQRLTSLAALLVIAAVLLHGRAVLAGETRRARQLYVAALALAVASLFAKESAAVVPLAVTAFDLAFCGGDVRARLRRLTPYFVLTGAVTALLLRPAEIASSIGQQFQVETGATGLPPWLAYLASQPRVLLTYLRLIVLPVGQCVDYDFPVASSLLAPSTLLPALALTVLLGVPSALAWRRRESWSARAVLFAVAWFLATLAVESSVFALPDLANEHRLYLPMAGIALAVGLVAEWSWLERLDAARARTLLSVTAAAAALALGSATFTRNGVWRDEETLWTDVVSKTPGRARGYVWLAGVRAQRGDLPSAIALLERATRLPTAYEPALANLGSYYAQVGRYADAEGAFRRALTLPGAKLASPQTGLGMLLLARGEPDAACGHFLAAVALNAVPRLARVNAAVCRQRSGDLRGAVQEWNRLLGEDPSDVAIQYNVAQALAQLGETREAAAAYRRFLAAAGAAYAPQRESAQRWLSESAGAGQGPHGTDGTDR